MSHTTYNNLTKRSLSKHLTVLLFAVFVAILCNRLYAAQAIEKPADIRVLVDVSGSMKKNDPRNLRQPAMDLLLQLFPSGSKAGVWTFGRYVNMLVNHDQVTDNWRNSAMPQTRLINSVALHTNIGLALEKANYDADPKRFPSTNQYNKAVILLTDGVVDIDQDPQVNDAERQRILNEVLPAYQRAGIKIHSVALSTNADAKLLETLSEATGGLFAVAEDAEDLNKIFLRAFDNAAAADRVPLQDNRFVVDSSIEEFTALVFKRADSALTELVSPSGEKYNAQSKSADLRWFASADYDLITIQRPAEGEWRINAELDPDNRVTVVSNLKLKIDTLPNTLYSTQTYNLVASVTSSGEVLRDKRFVDLLDVELAVQQSNQPLFEQTLNAENTERAVYRQPLSRLKQSGEYTLRVSVDGQTFKRERELHVQLKPGFSSQLTSNDDNGSFSVTVVMQDPALFNADISINGLLQLPSGKQQAIELKKIESSKWQHSAEQLASGSYNLTLKASGEVGGSSFSAQIASEQFSLNVPGAPEITALPEEAIVETAIVEPVKEPDPKPVDQTVEPVVEPLVESENKEKGTPRWVLYAALGLGNVLLLLGLFVAYKKLVANDSIADEEPAEHEDIKTAGTEQAEVPEAEVTAEADLVEDEDEEKNDNPDVAEAVDLAQSETTDAKEIEAPDKETSDEDKGEQEPDVEAEPESGEESEDEAEVAIDLDAMLDVDDVEVTQASAEPAEQEPDLLDEDLDAMLAELDTEKGNADPDAQEAEPDTVTEQSDDNDDIDVTLSLDAEFDLSADDEKQTKEQK